ncbi:MULTISPECIES: (2Fe-2S)-binding protein [Streptomyces]|uniref:(2Fe-2S)-binding protein n=1 Tax=Streptomyces lasalocidi TaxID=324833 RepID=A0A4U5W452_STRLS|nr:MULTISPECIES: (2Fe-2S)-binding protein [Streptomyces]MCX5000856.1 (2Fe-2S)-binding protein [Streptomyces longwoodensis]TKS96204.1 (2Fe-2S)-binding protein [Streptomyces lasalocidi]
MSHIVVDGEPLPFTEGQTIAAALVAAGRVAWRTTRINQRPRGVFCGIGVCFDCLVTIDGIGGQRACLVSARPDMTVTTEEGDDE